MVLTDTPLFDESDSVVLDTITGTWYAANTEGQDVECADFVPSQDHSYFVQLYNNDGLKQETMTVRFGYINEVLCGAMYNSEKKEYAIIAIRTTGKELEITALSVNKIESLMESKKIPFQCTVQSGMVKSIKLHGTTEQLHGFLKDLVKKESYWSDPIIMKRKN